MYDTYSSYQTAPDPSVVPDDNPFDLATPRVHGWRTGKPSSFTTLPADDPSADHDMESAEVGTEEGGGHLYAFQSMRPAPGTSGAQVRSGGRPPWMTDGSYLRSQDQGGAAARREVQGSDVFTDSFGNPVASASSVDFSSKTPGDQGIYYQEPDDSYFEMGRNAYPRVNQPWNNNRASARNTDDARATVPLRLPGAKQKTYVLSEVSQDAMRPVTYYESYGVQRRPFAPGRTAQTIGTIQGIPEWSQYSMQPSPAGMRQIPEDASAIDAQIAIDDGYTQEDVLY
jgi:hypothetical protein